MATDKLVDFDHVTDYISRETAITHIKENQRKGCSDIGLCGNCAVLIALKLLKNVQAANVRPVVKGTWEIADSYAGPGLMNLRCSVCGGFGGTWKDNTLPSMLYNFCPNCGADMREPNLDTTKGEDH